MRFSDLPPSKQWATLKYRGEKFAEVWFKPQNEPLALTFRIAPESFPHPSIGPQLTLANLLKAVGLAPTEVESSDVNFESPLLPPADAASHLEVHVRLKPPSQTVAAEMPDATKQGEGGISEIQWQDLEARWKAILVLEASIDSLRASMESLANELENSIRRTLTIEEKTYAARADIAQLDGIKNRVRFVVPRMRDFIHRATWTIASPERKRLGELYKDHIQPRIPFPQFDDVLRQLEDLQKDRQVLAAHGKTVYQDSRQASADVQSAVRNLQTSAEAQRRKSIAASKNRFFK